MNGSSDSYKGKVLFMDDEKMLRRVVSMMLESMEIEVDTASEGAEAVTMYQRRLDEDSKYDVVILDLKVTEGMGGIEAAQKIIASDPEARVYISTGFSSDPIITGYRRYGITGAIAKPYTAEELRALVSRALAHQE